MKYDVSFLSPKNEMVEIPLRVTGKISGAYVIVQEFISLLLAEPSNLREFGGGLYTLLQGSNVEREYIENAFSLAASNTTSYLHNNGILVGSCEVTDVVVNNDSVSITADLFVSGETVSFAVSIFLQES